MPLRDYNGPSNSPALLPHLQNETIKGAYFDAEGALCIVVSDGSALVLSSTLAGGNHGGAPTYHKRLPQEVAREVVQLAMAAERAAEAAKNLADLAASQAQNAENAKVAYGIEKEPPPDPYRHDHERWLVRVKKRSTVRTAEVLEKRDFDAEARRQRRPAAAGTLIGYKTGHGLCLQVEHTDGSHGWYEPDELTVLS